MHFVEYVLLSSSLAAALALPPSRPSSPTQIVAVAQGAAAAMRCMPFASQERLTNGTSFRAPITPALEVVLMSDPDGWIVQVEPAGDPGTDYLWIVSGPWQATPNRYLGEGFGLTARQSLAIKRTLRFVTTRGAYQEAMAIYTAATSGQAEGVAERLEQLGRGSLSLEITGFDPIGIAVDSGSGTQLVYNRLTSFEPLKDGIMAGVPPARRMELRKQP